MEDMKGSGKKTSPRKQAVLCQGYGKSSKQGEQHGNACTDAGVVWALDG